VKNSQRECARGVGPTTYLGLLLALALCASPMSAQSENYDAIYTNFGGNYSFSGNSWCVSGLAVMCGGNATVGVSWAAPFTPTFSYPFLGNISLPLTYIGGTNGVIVSLAQDAGDSGTGQRNQLKLPAAVDGCHRHPRD
jgi:hypothetical protein